MGSKAFATALAVALAASVAAGNAQEDQIGARGFEVDKVFNVGDVDSISLFNGNLTITLPIGQTYSVNGNLSYGFNAVYNSLVWEVGDRYDAMDDLTYSFANISKLWNAGVGWMVSPGRLFEPKLEPENPIEEDAWLYVDPSGAKHWFRDELHPGVDDGPSEYTNDSTYLRMRIVGATREIDFPNGNVTVFEDEDPGAGQDWRVTEMRDVYGNKVTVGRVTLPSGDIEETYTDDHLRSQVLTFEPDPGASERRLSQVDLTAFGGATATYSFTYDDLLIDRCYRDDDPDTPTQIWVSVLTEVLLPDGTTYEMLDGASPAYNDSCGGGQVLSGAIRRLRLRTRGEIRWDYSNYWLPYVLVPGQPGSGDRGEFEAGARGVSERRQYRADGTLLGTWKYTNEADVVTNEPLNTLLLDGETTTYVEYPTGDCSKHYFRAAPNKRISYGLPYSSFMMADSFGTFVSTEVWDDSTGTPTSDPDFPANFSCTGRKYRSSRVLYEDDGPGAGSDVNRRLVKSRTIYHELAGDRMADTTFSNFDGLGHYETETTGGTFVAGNVRTTTTDYELRVPTVSPTIQIPDATSAWILNTFAERSTTEGTSVNRETFCFDANGSLTRRRAMKQATAPASEGSADTVTTFTYNAEGNLTDETYFGGDLSNPGTGADLCALGILGANQYHLQHDYSNGVRKSTRYMATNGTSTVLELFDRTIDASTGLVEDSTDPGGVTTSFTYDALGRLTREQPATGHGARVDFSYTNATVGTKARVDIVRSTNDGSTVLAEERVVFDDLGRVFQEKRKVPTPAGSVFNLRETRYNGRGWKETVSEVVADGSTPTELTTFSEFDPFGRPGKITPPDGTSHDVVFVYKGAAEVSRTVMVGGNEGEYPSTTTEVFDRQGRLYQVLEPSLVGGAIATTTYSYDASDRLASVSMTDGTTTQNRFFTYDGRGFLSSEQHPEKGASFGGTVTYSDYDARGHVGRTQDGSSMSLNDLTFTYDRAERLVEVDETAGRDLKEFVYGTTGVENGKLISATRHNYLSRFLSGGQPVDLKIREIYTYDGVGGRASKRETERTDLNHLGGILQGPAVWFETEFTWTDLGDLEDLVYSTCTIPTECTGGGNPSGQPARTVTHGYLEGFLSSVGGFAGSIEYHPNETIASVEHANGVTDEFDLDPNSIRRPAAIRTVGVTGSANFDSGTYAYDGAGNVKAIGADTFTYDGVGRLLSGSAMQGTFSETSTYDAFGNRVSTLTAPVGSRAIPVDPETNRLLGTPERPVAYDSRGNQVQWGSANYEYDAFDQIVVHEDVPGGTDETFVYTADDERIIVVTNPPNADETWYLRDLDGMVLRKFHRDVGDTDWERDTIHHLGQVLATESADAVGVRHAHLDHLGTIRLWTRTDKTVDSRHDYTTFGEEVVEPIVLGADDYQYTGHERDVSRSGGCSGILMVDNQTISTGQTLTGCDEVSSTNTIIDSVDEVRFRAGDLISLDDFSVEAGATFVAEIDGGLNSDLQDLDYMHARFSSPIEGRFLSLDPSEESVELTTPQSWNKYAYGRANPMKYVDPDGAVTAATIADQAQLAIAQSKEAATAGLSDGSVAGIFTATLVGTTADLASALLEPLRAGAAVGEAIGSRAGALETTVAAGVDALRVAGIAAPLTGVARTVSARSVFGGRTLRSGVQLFGGRSGQRVKDLVGPKNSVVRGGGNRLFVTNKNGEVILDVTRNRVKSVTPGVGFGSKRAPTKRELDFLRKVFPKE